MREIVGATSVIDGKAQSISGVRVLGRYRLQIRLTRPVGDFTARLTLPFFCPILPNTPIAEINDPAGSGPYYVYDRVVNQRIVLKRNPFYRGDRPANVDQVVYTISESQEACQLAVEQDRIDQCTFGLPETSYRALAEKYGINRPGGQFFVSPMLSTWFVAFNHDRPRVQGPRPDPAREGDQLRNRPARAGPGVRIPGRQARPTSCYHPISPAPQASTRSRAPTPPPRGNGSRGRGPGRTRSSSTRPTIHPVSNRPRCSPSTSSRSASTSR